MLDTEPQLVENYVKTGKLKIVFWHLLDFGANSQAAAEAAECAGEQGLFWPMHDILYERQSETWSHPRQTAVTLARDVNGLDIPSFEQCMDEERYAQKVKADNSARSDQHVRVRPTFEINGRRVEGALPYAQLSQILDQALANR